MQHPDEDERAKENLKQQALLKKRADNKRSAKLSRAKKSNFIASLEEQIRQTAEENSSLRAIFVDLSAVGSDTAVESEISPISVVETIISSSDASDELCTSICSCAMCGERVVTFQADLLLSDHLVSSSDPPEECASFTNENSSGTNFSDPPSNDVSATTTVIVSENNTSMNSAGNTQQSGAQAATAGMMSDVCADISDIADIDIADLVGEFPMDFYLEEQQQVESEGEEVDVTGFL